MNKKKTLTIVLIFVVLLLGGASVYVATQLSTRKTVAPTAPESKPKAVEPTITWVGSEACSTTGVATAIDCVPSGVVTCDPDCPTSCGKAASTITTCTDSCGVAKTKECPATDDCTTEVVVTQEVTKTVTVIVTASPTTTVTATQTATPTKIASVAATPTVLPEAGIFDLPGVIAFGGGLLLAVVGILLAL